MKINERMKTDVFILVKAFIVYETLFNSVKYFTYLYDKTCFNIATFAIYNPSLRGVKYDTLVLSYGKFKFDLTFVFIIFISLFFISVLTYFYFTKKSLFNYIYFIFLYLLILKTDLIRLYKPEIFYLLYHLRVA